MKRKHWLWLLSLLALLGLAVGCGPLPTRSSAEPTPADQPTNLPTATPTIEPVPPRPEYRIELVLDPAGRRLTGQQRVTVPNHSGVAWNEIIFRLYPNLPQYGGAMTVSAAWVDGQSSDFSLRAEDTALAIPLPEPLPPERVLGVDLTFQVEIPQVEAGYALFSLSRGIWCLPDAYPLLAVHDGSTWHEDVAPAHGDAVFAETGAYDVVLTLPEELILVATGAVVSHEQTPEGRRAYRIVGGPLREFAWLASADYRVAEAAADGITLRSFYLLGDETAGKAALGFAAAALHTYQDAYGPYPYDRMIVAAAPLLHYGMEYPGLNLIGVDLYREHQDELEDRVVHEIAHQWWYAQVGNDQVNTPWLDEGLAEYSMALYYGQEYGEERAEALVNQRWLVPYQVAVQNQYDAVVNQPSAAFTWEYEVIVYGKAALFFHALHQELGDEVYKAVLREYVQRYQWGIATPDGLLDVAESVAGRDLDSLYNQWILSKQ